MKREIEIRKRAGESLLIEQIRDVVSMWLETCPSGDWTLKLEKKKVQRGLSQNALLWVWMSAVAEEWGGASGDYYTKEQWKEFFTRMFLPVTMPDGSVVGGSTSKLTVEQMTDFLTKIQAYAATEWGITLLGAEDSMFNEWRSQYE